MELAARPFLQSERNAAGMPWDKPQHAELEDTAPPTVNLLDSAGLHRVPHSQPA
ncbi:MAG: hypothetical protein DVB23_002159 [Verrucomicrobia bacterium]|nr:MAG: hypothetical protein DVB23_002159 [Verrucomicrobiota bacterium]